MVEREDGLTADLRVGVDPWVVWPVGVVRLPAEEAETLGAALRFGELMATYGGEEQIPRWAIEWLLGPLGRMARDGDPWVPTRGRYVPTLAGIELRSEDGSRYRFESPGAAAEYAARLLRDDLENVWWGASQAVAGPAVGLSMGAARLVLCADMLCADALVVPVRSLRPREVEEVSGA